MLLKRFEGKTLAQALTRVRAECGDDALLVETRPTRTGFLVVAARQDQMVPPSRTQAAAVLPLPRWTRGFQQLAVRGADFGLSERVLRAVENALLGTKVQLGSAGDPALPRLCQRVLQALIRVEARLEGQSVAPEFQTQVLVGPTGVGKTTTLAKLAARAVHQGQRVAIVTLDTYRVAAVEQLRAFADLLDLPLEVAFTPQDLRRALQQHRECDRIFVDTTGKSPLDREAIRALHGTLGSKATTLLCVAAGTRRRDAEVILDTYEQLGIAAVLLTKWDETLVPGETLSLLVERGVPLSHVTIGQEVPADILAADPAQLAAAAFDTEPRLAEVTA